jgi:hypothetical protein
MEFTFSIRGALKEAWDLFKKHIWFFVGLSAISVILNFIGGGKHTPGIVSLILTIASFIWSIVLVKFSLAAADGKDESLSFNKIQSMLPTGKQALGFLGVALLGGLLILGGLVLLIIPGIYIAIRLSVANLSFIDKNQGVKASLKSSWDMIKGSTFWTAVLVMIASVFLYMIGLVLFGIGILVTYPLAMILMAKFYRALTVQNNQHSVAGESTATVVQPVEIEAPIKIA